MLIAVRGPHMHATENARANDTEISTCAPPNPRPTTGFRSATMLSTRKTAIHHQSTCGARTTTLAARTTMPTTNNPVNPTYTHSQRNVRLSNYSAPCRDLPPRIFALYTLLSTYITVCGQFRPNATGNWQGWTGRWRRSKRHWR